MRTHAPRRGARCILFCLGAILLCACVRAEDAAPVAPLPVIQPQAPAAATPAETTVLTWCYNKLNPKNTCPHCGHGYRKASSFWMLMLGFLGQAVFTSRFLVQWIASERRKESYVPVAFWHLSIVGSLLLLVYAISILAWPIVLGQAAGLIPYWRNLHLIGKNKKKNDSAADDMVD